MTNGEYLGAGSGTTKLLLHLNGSSTDTSGNGNNGTDTSITYSQANGKFGQGAGFNGSSSAINLNKTASSLGFSTSTMTYSVWFKTTASGSQYYLIGVPNNSGFTFYGFGGLRVNSSTTAGFVFYNTGGTFYESYPTVGTLNDGNWHNIVVTLDGSNWKIYFEGLLKATTAYTGSISYDGSRFPAVGARVENSFGNYWNGSIDEVIIENRAWSAEEIKKYYTYAKGQFGL
jgi:hypothetical protein